MFYKIVVISELLTALVTNIFIMMKQVHQANSISGLLLKSSVANLMLWNGRVLQDCIACQSSAADIVIFQQHRDESF